MQARRAPAFLVKVFCLIVLAGSVWAKVEQTKRVQLIKSVQWDGLCAELIEYHCPDAPQASNPSTVWECVVDHQRDATASLECAEAVRKTERELAASSLLIDPEVCGPVSKILKCETPSPDHPVDTECLLQSMLDIDDLACQRQVQRYVRELSDSFAVGGPDLEEACGADREKFCAKEDDGDGRVHRCLRSHYSELQVCE